MKPLEHELRRALSVSAAPDADALERTLRLCRAQQARRPRAGWRELMRCQTKLLGWKAWAMEGIAALALYAVDQELGLWDAAWSLRNLLFGLTALAMCTALLGLPFLCKASQYKMLELERATRAGMGGPLLVRFLLLLAGELVLLGVLAFSVHRTAPLSLGQLLSVLSVPFLLANNELLLLLRRVRPEKLVLVAVPLFAGQLVLLRLVQGPDLPPFLPLTAGVLAVCMGGQCARLAARTEYTVEV